VVNHLKYDDFGTITSESNSPADPHFAHTGRDRDHDAGLYDYGARWSRLRVATVQGAA
jgi:hypothetical protein